MGSRHVFFNARAFPCSSQPARDASRRVSSFLLHARLPPPHQRTRTRTTTDEDGDGSTQGAQTTKRSFVVCALGSRRVSSRYVYFFLLTNFFIQVFFYLLSVLYVINYINKLLLLISSIFFWLEIYLIYS